MSKRLVFFGTEDFSAASLEALIDAGYDIAAVVTKPDMVRGRGQKLVQPVVKMLAAKNNIAVLQPTKLDEITGFLTNQAPLTGVLVSYGKILPQRIIDLFEIGIINVHPSLLPRYRGPSPIESAILNGDNETGISIMLLTAAMDAGPVYAQKTIPLTGSENRLDLTEQLAHDGATLLVETLPSILEKSLTPEPQNDSAATYCSLLSKADSPLNPVDKTAHELERQIRAHLGYPKSRCIVSNSEVIVTKAHIVDSASASEIVVACQDDTFLAIDELVAPSGRTMKAADFLRGYQKS